MSARQAIGKYSGTRFLYNITRTHGWPYLISWIHRISGIVLVFYVVFHIITLSSLQNPEVFQGKMHSLASIFPPFFEWLLAFPVIFHSLNGGRLLLYEIFGNRKDQTVLGWVYILSLVYVVLLGFFMALGNQRVSAILFWVYMFIISIFLVFVIIKKIQQSGASSGWKLQRISAAFLFVMIPAHMLYMHLDPSIGRDAQTIINRMDNGFIKLVDFLLVISVLYHGGYGLIGIARDYISSKQYQLVCRVLISGFMALFALIGIKLIFLVG